MAPSVGRVAGQSPRGAQVLESKVRALVAASGLRCEVYSPVAAGLARRAGLERGQALVQSAERPALHEFLPRWKALLEPTMQRRVRWTFDIDPLEFA